MENASKPNISIAKRVLPQPLYRALTYIFEQNISDAALVGGTALSGFYAGHRRSDDLDLFVKNEVAFSQTLLAVKSLSSIGTKIRDVAHSNQYYKVICSLNGHDFTVDVVKDENLFNVGTFNFAGRISVADLPTLFMLKSAALLSRCGEKDLYDLSWLVKNLKGFTYRDIVKQGGKIDSGMKLDTLLYSISSSQIRKEACAFSLDSAIDSKMIYDKLIKFKKILVKELSTNFEDDAVSELKPVVDFIRKYNNSQQ